MNNQILFLSLAFYLLAQSIMAQDASVEKSTFGIQTGFLGVWIHNESKLSNSIALRSELGIDAAIFDNSVVGGSGLIMVPAITLEPRWYYNLIKRASKSRRIDGNSGNFLSIKTTYHPDIILSSVDDRVNFISDFSIVPTWGIRRHIGKHFTYETGIGVGYIRYLEDVPSIFETADITVNLHLRFGYKF